MQWSQLKHQIEGRFAPALRGRVALHQARYRHTREEYGRIWLTIDGAEIAEFSTPKGSRQRAEIADALNEANGTEDYRSPSQRPGYLASDAQALRIGRQSGVVTDYEAAEQLLEYLSLSIEDAQQSDSPFIRALAIADARTGKRRLKALAPGDGDHILVRALFALRMERVASGSDRMDA